MMVSLKSVALIAIIFLPEKLSFSKNLKNFFLLLIKKRRIFFVLKIINSFLKLCSKKRGEIKASLISSKELTKSELENISKDLSSSMGATIKFDYKIDKEKLDRKINSKIFLGDIKNTFKEFLKDNPAPISGIFIPVIYSSGIAHAA